MTRDGCSADPPASSAVQPDQSHPGSSRRRRPCGRCPPCPASACRWPSRGPSPSACGRRTWCARAGCRSSAAARRTEPLRSCRGTPPSIGRSSLTRRCSCRTTCTCPCSTGRTGCSRSGTAATADRQRSSRTPTGTASPGSAAGRHHRSASTAGGASPPSCPATPPTRRQPPSSRPHRARAPAGSPPGHRRRSRSACPAAARTACCTRPRPPAPGTRPPRGTRPG